MNKCGNHPHRNQSSSAYMRSGCQGKRESQISLFLPRLSMPSREILRHSQARRDVKSLQ